MFFLLYKHQWNTKPFHSNSFFGMEGAIYYVAIAKVLFSHVKISSFLAKAHLVFHLCLYNKASYFFTTEIVKYMEKNLDITKPCYINSKQILPVPWLFVVSRFHCSCFITELIWIPGLKLHTDRQKDKTFHLTGLF